MIRLEPSFCVLMLNEVAVAIAAWSITRRQRNNCGDISDTLHVEMSHFISPS